MKCTTNPRRAALGPGLLLAASLLGCHREDKTPPPPPPVQLAPQDVIAARTATVEAGPLVSGTLEAADSATMRAQLGGTITKIGPELGQPVHAKDLLVQIDTRGLGDAAVSARAQLAAAKAELDVAAREVERTKALVDAGAIARRDYDTAVSRSVAAEAQVNQAVAQQASAAKQLDDATVRSPINGVVAQRAVNVGDVVQPGATLYQIIDPSSMRLSASVPSDQLGQLRAGQAVKFTVHGYPDQTFTGTLARIAPAADPTTKQIAILVDLPNPSHMLLAGLFAKGRIAAQQATGVVIPLAAVDTRANPPSVLRVAGGTVEAVAVKLGLRDPLRDEVMVTGINAGDRVLARVNAAPPAGAHVVLPPQS